MTKVDAVEQSPVFLQKKIKLTFFKQKTNSMQIIKAYSLTIKRTANFKRMEEGRMETTIQNTGKKRSRLQGLSVWRQEWWRSAHWWQAEPRQELL